MIPSTTTATHTVNRPVVDLNLPIRDLSSSSSSSSADISSSSSLLSLPPESDISIRKEPEGASHYIINDKSSAGLIYARQRPNSLSQKRSITPPSNQIKSSECFGKNLFFNNLHHALFFQLFHQHLKQNRFQTRQIWHHDEKSILNIS
jgi:hypothetical protein